MANPFDPLFKKPVFVPVPQVVGEVPVSYAVAANEHSMQRYDAYCGHLTENQNRSMNRGPSGSRRHHNYLQNGKR